MFGNKIIETLKNIIIMLIALLLSISLPLTVFAKKNEKFIATGFLNSDLNIYDRENDASCVMNLIEMVIPRGYKIPDNLITAGEIPIDDSYVQQILEGNEDYELNHDILEDKEKYKVQILYTHIKRGEDGKVIFTPYSFNLDRNNYFYPASSIKLAGVMAGIEKVNKSGGNIFNDVLFDTGEMDKPSNYITRIFHYSDNHSFDMMFNLMGIDEFNSIVRGKGYSSFIGASKLAGNESDLYSYGYKIESENDIIYSQDERYGEYPEGREELKNTSVGVGFYENGGNYIPVPMDFTGRNTISIEDLQGMLKQVFFRDSLKSEERFDLSPEDIDFVKEAMLGDGTGDYKWFFCGGSSDLPEGVKVYNKIGNAYGFLTDNAYVIDDEGNEFMLTATIYCNESNVLNSGSYDYETVGQPFLKNLGYIFLDYTKALNNKYYNTRDI